MSEIVISILIPLIGTVLGASCVFICKNGISNRINKIFTGLAAGVMIAAAFWSLILPALEQSSFLGIFSFLPVALGIAFGFAFLMVLEKLIPRLQNNKSSNKSLKKSAKMILAIVLHNLPEGIAVGVSIAGSKNESAPITAAATLVLALGIAIQNFPEGAIVSIPLHKEEMKKGKAFLFGALSGVVEPIAAVTALVLAELVTPLLPFMLSFAAGAMLFVVIEELIPEMYKDSHSNIGTISFVLGFSFLMILDSLMA